MNTYRYNELYIGMKEEFTVSVDNEKLEKFKQITNDINPLHNDSSYAQSKGYADKVVFGLLTGSFMSTLAGVYLPGQNSLIHQVEMKFLKPVIVGDTLKILGEVVEKNDMFKTITLKVEIFRLEDSTHNITVEPEKILRGKMQVGVMENE